MPLSLNLFPKEKSAAEHPLVHLIMISIAWSHMQIKASYTQISGAVAESIKAQDRKVKR